MDLTPLMKPTSVAVVGASQRMGRATRVVANLQRFGYGGRVFPINPKYPDIFGLPCYPDMASTPSPANVAVVAIPAEQVPRILEVAFESGVRAAVVLSAAGEAGPVGKARGPLERLAVERGCSLAARVLRRVFNLRDGVATFSADCRAAPTRPSCSTRSAGCSVSRSPNTSCSSGWSF
jgi:acyl-CoA synthetase (NDP forming)